MKRNGGEMKGKREEEEGRRDEEMEDEGVKVLKGVGQPCEHPCGRMDARMNFWMACGHPCGRMDGRMNLWMASRGFMRSINGHFPVFPCIAHPNNQKMRKYKAEFTYTSYKYKV